MLTYCLDIGLYIFRQRNPAKALYRNQIAILLLMTGTLVIRFPVYFRGHKLNGILYGLVRHVQRHEHEILYREVAGVNWAYDPVEGYQ